MIRMKDQTCIITGGAKGIGRACVHKFLVEGAYVLLIDSDEEALNVMQSKYELEFGSRLQLIKLDVTKEEDRCLLVEKALAWRGSFEILINNAAAFIMEGVGADDASWKTVFDTNVIACAKLSDKMALQDNWKNNNRAIVNICSISATHAQPKFATYNASKGALLTLTKCMALDLAKQGIRVNAVSPGTIWTKSNAFHIQRKYNIDRNEADIHPDLGAKHILGRLGEPQEVANAVCFLASSEASFITGANLYVDGGYSVL